MYEHEWTGIKCPSCSAIVSCDTMHECVATTDRSLYEHDVTVLAGNYTVVPPWLELTAALIRIADCLERIEKKMDAE